MSKPSDPCGSTIALIPVNLEFRRQFNQPISLKEANNKKRLASNHSSVELSEFCFRVNPIQQKPSVTVFCH